MKSPAPLVFALLALVAPSCLAHGIVGDDALFVANNHGVQFAPFVYLGAKHMVTGYDHLLFLLGTIFFVYRSSHIALYVTLFSIGHSITLLTGVLAGVRVDPNLIDTIIGLSVVYKAFDNLAGFKTLLGVQIDQRLAVLVFGLFHGFGLATKLQTLSPARDGLWQNMLAFNLGVELGQLIALCAMLGLIVAWRRRPSFQRHAVLANALLMTGGFVLMGYQLAAHFYGQAT